MRRRLSLTPLVSALGATALAFVACACDGDEPPLPSPPPAESALEDTTSSSAGAETASSSASTTSADPGALAALAGAWEAAYDAKKGRVGMPPGVPDPARAADDGKSSSGPGTVAITISESGDVTGKSEGALGKASIRGKIDGKMLRASFVPDDPLAPRAMTGVLVGILKGDVFQTEIRVAGPDALIVRQANFDLTRKK
ncbi:MAG: hypothetical protein R3B70_35415 [Polyangiaceae bacterium]